jgi:hypothetical protein
MREILVAGQADGDRQLALFVPRQGEQSAIRPPVNRERDVQRVVVDEDGQNRLALIDQVAGRQARSGNTAVDGCRDRAVLQGDLAELGAGLGSLDASYGQVHLRLGLVAGLGQLEFQLA